MTGVLRETHDAAGRIDRAALLLRPLSALREKISEMVAASGALTASQLVLTDARDPSRFG